MERQCLNPIWCTLFQIETRESLEISDYRGKQQGLLDVEIIPCDDKGKELTEADDVFVDDPKDLISRCVNFVIKIKTVTGVPNRFKVILSHSFEWISYVELIIIRTVGFCIALMSVRLYTPGAPHFIHYYCSPMNSYASLHYNKWCGKVKGSILILSKWGKIIILLFLLWSKLQFQI